MYTISVIGLLIFPVGFLFILQFGLNLSATQTVLVLCGYGSVVSLVGLVHSVRCGKRKKQSFISTNPEPRSLKVFSLKKPHKKFHCVNECNQQKNCKYYSIKNSMFFFFAPHSIDKPINYIYYIKQNTVKYDHQDLFQTRFFI